MKYPKIDINDARLVVRSLGLLLNQAAVYGPVHNVTKSATNRVFEELSVILKRYHVLELTVKSNLICVNGSSEEIDSSISSNLVRRFGQLDITGLLFTLPLTSREFERAVRVLSMPIALITEASGVRNLFERESIKSVAVVQVDYKRVEGNAINEDSLELINTKKSTLDIDDETTTPKLKIVDHRKTPAATSTITANNVIDLSEDLSDSGLDYSDFGLQAPEEKRAEERKERQRQSSLLADLLRQTAQALESNIVADPEDELQLVISALDRVRSQLLEMSRGSEKAISSLARDVDADKLTVAGLEAEAKRRGYLLNLTREELLERYAELNQEIIQPLTVSTGVIEMLRKEQVGAVSESQQELLKMAHESIERVNQLVGFMHGVSGLPSTFSPDANLIKDSYHFNQ